MEGKIMTKVVIQMTDTRRQISGDVISIGKERQLFLALVSGSIQLIFAQCIELTRWKEKRPRG
jgi:hypothetical protein